MIEQELFVESMKDTSQEIIAAKNDPILQGTNGTLTLGFIITMTVSFIGFLIYWIFNIRERTLQFGILRAMGLPKKKLIGMIIAEQLLISGSAIVAGILIGTLASSLYVPLLQVVYSPAEQVPPFVVVSYLSDYLRMFVILFIMLAIGCIILGVLISKIKMDQALKLGED
jgi:putative ABC transport system permease protein